MAGAEARPHREFPDPRGRFYQQHICQIRTGDQEHACDGTPQDKQKLTHLPNDILVQGNGGQELAAVCTGLGRCELTRQVFKFGSNSFKRCARTQPRDYAHVA